MKKCKACAKEIDDKATKCPHCQTDQRNWFMRHKITTGFLALILLIIILAAAGSGSKTNKTSVPATADKITQDQPAQTTTKTVAATPPAAQQSLLDISGSGTKSTQKFTAAGDWDLNWTYNCKNFGNQGNFQVFVYNGDGSTSFQNSPVNQLGASGTDVEHYHNGGTFYLQVNSECNWKIQVKG